MQHEVARCSGQLIGPADWVLSHWDAYAVISLEAVAYSSYCNTVEFQGGIEAYLSGQLASFSALTLLVGSLDL